MRWNWQHTDWPAFTFDEAALRPLEDSFLRDLGRLEGVSAILSEEEQLDITLEQIAGEAVQTSAIEGELLNRHSVQVSLRRLLGLATDHRKVDIAERRIAELMVALYRQYAAPMSHEALYAWHQLLMQGRVDIQSSGRYRQHPEPMQIISGPLAYPVVHFEAPPSTQVPAEMDQFLRWLNGPARQLPLLTRMGLAHIYFESIHPFEDGNGRIGRALIQKILAEALGRPIFLSVSEFFERNKKQYYAELGAASRTLDMQRWLLWFAEQMRTAQAWTIDRVQLLLEKAAFFQKWGTHLNPRQEKVMRRLFDVGPEGFTGGLSARNYMRITKTSQATATRDLQDLVAKHALVKTGQLKGTRYYLRRK